MKINAPADPLLNQAAMEWQLIATAPYDADLELAVIDATGVHSLVFPCNRIPAGWLKSGTSQWVEVHPTHWRNWF